MSIIFLDIDGVLNSKTYFDKINSRILSCNINYHDIYDNNLSALIEFAMMRIDPVCLNRVIRLANETESSIVMTSGWSTLYYYPNVLRRLNNVGLPINNYLSTSFSDRAVKIEAFINNIDENFVIIDTGDFVKFNENLYDNLVLVDKKVGFTEEDYNKAIEIIGRGIKRKKEVK